MLPNHKKIDHKSSQNHPKMLPGASWAPSWLPTSKLSSIFSSWAPSWSLWGLLLEALGRPRRALGELSELLGLSWGALGTLLGELLNIWSGSGVVFEGLGAILEQVCLFLRINGFT